MIRYHAFHSRKCLLAQSKTVVPRMLFIILAVVFVYLCYAGVYKPMLFWKNKGVPYVQPAPLLGNAWRAMFVMESFIDTMKYMYNQYENQRYFGIFLFTQPSLCIRDLNLIKQIGIKDFDHFVDHINVIEPEADPIVKNLLNMRGNDWRQLRATLSPVFTSSKMRGMYLLMKECAKDVTDYLRAKNEESFELELKELFTKYSNDVIASAAFGIKCDSLTDEKNEFYAMGKRITKVSFTRIVKLCLYLIIPSVMRGLKVRLFPKEVTGFFHRIVMETKKVREEQNIHRPDLLELLFEAQKGRLKPDDEATEEKQQKYKLEDEDITAQAAVFFLAGFDTVSTALSFMLLELAIHPEIQDILQKEIDDVLATGELTYERVLTMSYLDQVVSEALRKWPPVFETDRMCTKTYTIPAVQEGERSLTLEIGSSIIIPIIAIHYDPKYYPDPNKFDPERFSDENKASLVSGSYMPFGVGPRNCIGSRFALLEIKIMAVRLLSQFNVMPTEKTKLPIKLSAKMSSPMPEGGFWIGFKPRKVTAL